MIFVDELAKENRFIEIFLSNMYEKYSKKDGIILKLSELLYEYSKYNSLSVSDISERYLNFLKDYNHDIKYFLKNNEYFKGPIDRLEYDLALIISAILTEHRRSIVKLLSKSVSDGNICVIGAGPGIELKILSPEKAFVYDPLLPDFTKSYFSNENIVFKKEEFDGKRKFDHIYAIELLEHVDDINRLIKKIKCSMLEDSFFYTTYAFDVPQRDHVNNISEDGLESIFYENNLNILEKKKILHHSKIEGFYPYNIFYILRSN